MRCLQTSKSYGIDSFIFPVPRSLRWFCTDAGIYEIAALWSYCRFPENGTE